MENSEISANTNQASSDNIGININAKQNITLSASSIHSNSDDVGESVPISLSAGGDILLQDESAISTSSHSDADSGDINISAQNLTVESQSNIKTITYAVGNAGDININSTDTFSLSDSTSIGVSSSALNFTGNAGNIDVTANGVNLDHGFLFTHSGPHNSGTSGDLSIQANTLAMSNNSSVFNDTAGSEEAGAINLRVKDGIFMKEASRIYNASSGELLGKAGDLFIDTSELKLEDRSVLSTTSEGTGNTGDLHIVADRIISSSSHIYTKALQGSTGQSGEVSISASEFMELSSPLNIGGDDRAFISSHTDSSQNAGDITLSTPKLTISNAQISSTTQSSGNGGNIYINVDSLTLSHCGVIHTGNLTADATGNSGAVHINAKDSLTIEGYAQYNGVHLISNITTSTSSTGDSGDIRISAPVVNIDSGWLNASSIGSGASGSVILRDIERLSLTGGGSILTVTTADGEGGHVDINARSIHISGINTFLGITSGVRSSSMGSGRAGSLVLQGEHLVLDQGGRLESTASDSGNAGTITIGSPQSPISNLTLMNNSVVSTATTGLGNAGDIHINATGAVTLRGKTPGPRISSSALSSDPSALGSAGTLTLNANTLDIMGSGTITTNTQSHHGTLANIQIVVNDLLIQGEDTNTLQAIAALEKGQQPQVPITGITSNASADQQGGDIIIYAAHQAILLSGVISASGSGSGGGGNVYVGSSTSPVALFAIDGNSAILARAQKGNGGKIYLSPDISLRDNVSRISADSIYGNAGVVEIDNVEQDITGSILGLDNTLMAPNQLISQTCDTHQARQQSSLTLSTQNGFRLSPRDYIPSKMSRTATDEHMEKSRAAWDN
jgi:large exoprotein involved in heme utilization and adhesion